MKCPNCRCIVPNNVSRCTYCGYDFMSGSAKTLTIEEAYKFKHTIMITTVIIMQMNFMHTMIIIIVKTIKTEKCVCVQTGN